MDAKDVLGDSCEQMLAAANSKRHAELITRLKELVKGLDEGRFVASAPADADAAGAEISAEDVGDAELPATLTDDQVEEILAPLRLAMESKSPKVIRAPRIFVAKVGVGRRVGVCVVRRSRPRARWSRCRRRDGGGRRVVGPGGVLGVDAAV